MKTRKPTLSFIVFHAKDGWRWHAKRRGRIVAESGEGYVRKAACLRSLKNLLYSALKSDYSLSEGA